MFDKIKYYFLDKEGRSYYLTNSGNVDKSATPKPLELAPEGRKSITIGYERSITDKELGVVRSFTFPTEFGKKASRILKSILYTKNIGEKIYLLIQKLKVTVDIPSVLFRMKYQFLYKGEVDLTSFVDKDERTSVTISEGGIAKQIKSNEGNTYEFNLDSDKDAVLVKHDGMNLYDTVNFAVTPIDQKTVFGAGSGRYLPASMISREGTAAGFAGFANSGTTTYNEPPPIEQAEFYTSQVITGMKIRGKIKVQIDFTYTPTPPFQTTEKYVLCLNSNLRQGSIFNTPGIAYLNPNGKNGEPLHSQTNTVEFDFDVTFDSLENEYFFIYAYGPPFSVTIAKFEYLETNFKIEFKSRFKTTYVKGLPLSILGKRLTAKNTGSENNIDTSFLSQHDNLIILSGDNMRSIPNGKVKTTLKDYKDFVWCVLSASRGIENSRLTFDEFPHFLDYNDPIELGPVANLEVNVAKDLICNTIKTGYPVQQIDDVNGKYSFNNTFNFSTPLELEQPKSLDLVTNYLTDAYYQEIIRINLDGKTTTDDTGDNQVMVLNTDQNTEVITGTDILIDSDSNGNYFSITGVIDKADFFKTKFTVSGTTSNNGTYTVKNVVIGVNVLNVYVNENIVTETVSAATFSVTYYTLKRASYSSISGIPDPDTIYNIEELTPKRILLKHRKWINSIFYGFQGQKITFESTEKNADLETTLSGTAIKEKSSYEIGTDILFKPFYFDFDTIAPVDTVEILETNINRCFSFEWYGKTYKGFLRKAGASTNDNKSQKFKLLCTPDTDLTNLIF